MEQDKQKKHMPDVPGLAVRQTAGRLLGAVVDKKTSLDGLTDNENGHPHYLVLPPRDRALLRAILGASLRHRGVIDAALSQSLDRPLPDNAHALKHLLHISIAQILYLDVPDHAAIDLAVTAAKVDPRNRRFANLCNAVLRKIARNKTSILDNAAVISNAPQWFSAMLEKAYGHKKAEAILNVQAYEPPIDLTVKENPELWAEKLSGIVLPNGSVRLEMLQGPLHDMLGFVEGEWWVQDAAASLPARLMGKIKGKRVADLCAAPGGKTAQLALAGADVTAVDLSPNRLKRLIANMERLKFKVETWSGNLKHFSPATLFDAVLLDAPCSSTGTVRRHPDILWTKEPADITKLATVQYELLQHALTLVKSSGIVVFANCSLSPEEGEDLVAKLLKQHKNIKLVAIKPSELKGFENLITANGTLRSTPADLDHENKRLAGMDGFFAARFMKD